MELSLRVYLFTSNCLSHLFLPPIQTSWAQLLLFMYQISESSPYFIGTISSCLLSPCFVLICSCLSSNLSCNRKGIPSLDLEYSKSLQHIRKASQYHPFAYMDSSLIVRGQQHVTADLWGCGCI